MAADVCLVLKKIIKQQPSESRFEYRFKRLLALFILKDGFGMELMSAASGCCAKHFLRSLNLSIFDLASVIKKKKIFTLRDIIASCLPFLFSSLVLSF